MKRWQRAICGSSLMTTMIVVSGGARIAIKSWPRSFTLGARSSRSTPPRETPRSLKICDQAHQKDEKGDLSMEIAFWHDLPA
jgi:hypothetical protein